VTCLPPKAEWVNHYPFEVENKGGYTFLFSVGNSLKNLHNIKTKWSKKIVYLADILFRFSHQQSHYSFTLSCFRLGLRPSESSNFALTKQDYKIREEKKGKKCKSI